MVIWPTPPSWGSSSTAAGLSLTGIKTRGPHLYWLLECIFTHAFFILSIRYLLTHNWFLPISRHLRTDSDSEVLLNVLADEVHRAHQRCLQTTGCDPNKMKVREHYHALPNGIKVLNPNKMKVSLVTPWWTILRIGTRTNNAHSHIQFVLLSGWFSLWGRH